MTSILFFSLLVTTGCQTKDPNAQLMTEIRSGNIDEVKRILESKTIEIEPVQAADRNNKPLAYAIFSSNLEMVELIHKHGGDINAPGIWGDVPLVKALEHKKFDVAKYLIDNGADVNIPNAVGLSPFIGMCGITDVELVRLGIENGGDVNRCYTCQTTEPKGNNFTPLGMAVKQGKTEIVKLLIANGADPKLGGLRDQTCLEIAGIDAKPEMLNLLK